MSITEQLKSVARRERQNPKYRLSQESLQRSRKLVQLASQTVRAFRLLGTEVGCEQTIPLIKQTITSLFRLDTAIGYYSLPELGKEIVNIGIKTPFEVNPAPGEFVLLFDYSHGEHQTFACLARIEDVKQEGIACSTVDLAKIIHQPPNSFTEIAVNSQTAKPVILGSNERVVLSIPSELQKIIQLFSQPVQTAA